MKTVLLSRKSERKTLRKNKSSHKGDGVLILKGVAVIHKVKISSLFCSCTGLIHFLTEETQLVRNKTYVKDYPCMDYCFMFLFIL